MRCREPRHGGHVCPVLSGAHRPQIVDDEEQDVVPPARAPWGRGNQQAGQQHAEYPQLLVGNQCHSVAGCRDAEPRVPRLHSGNTTAGSDNVMAHAAHSESWTPSCAARRDSGRRNRGGASAAVRVQEKLQEPLRCFSSSAALLEGAKKTQLRRPECCRSSESASLSQPPILDPGDAVSSLAGAFCETAPCSKPQPQ